MKKPTVLKNEPKADAVGGRTRANARGHILTNNKEVDARRSFSDWIWDGETAENCDSGGMAPCDGPGERGAPDFSAGGGFGAICRNCRGDGRGGWRAASRFRVDGEESGIPSGMHELLER